MMVTGGKEKAVRRQDLIGGVRLYVPARDRQERPMYVYRPHYYSCPVLRAERRAWREKQRETEPEA